MFSPDSPASDVGSNHAAIGPPSPAFNMFSSGSEAEGGLCQAPSAGKNAVGSPTQHDGAMFSPDSHMDVEGEHRVVPLAVAATWQGLTLIERKQARAAYARAARVARATAMIAVHELQPAGVPTWSWPSKKEEEAAHALLYDPMLTSWRAASRIFQIDYRKMQRWETTAACITMDAERIAFKQLLAEVKRLDAEGFLQPTLFVWGRMYDETPARHWTHVLKEGQMQGQTSIAKVMAALLTFSMVLEIRPRHALDLGPAQGCSIQAAIGDPPPCCVTGGPEAMPPDGRQDRTFVIIRGSLGTRLAAMGQQTGNVVRECIHQIMSLQPDEKCTVDAVFHRKCILRETDLHRSGLAAERAEARADPTWASTMFRCGMHRSRTAELFTLGLDSKTESFFLNCTLVLRQQPDAMRSLRERIDSWATKALRVYLGKPPPEVQEWRRAMRVILFNEHTSSISEAARQHCWDHVLNGDGRVQAEVQHYCEGVACCPNGVQDTLKKVLGPCGVGALLSPMPKLFPRRSWHGQCEVVSHVLQLECTHGMLSQNFKNLEAAARQRAERALRRLAEERRQRMGLAASQAQPVDAANVPVQVTQAQVASDLAEEAAQRSRDVLEYLLDPAAVPRMVRMRLVLESSRMLKSSMLLQKGLAWEATQCVAASRGCGREYPVVVATSGDHIKQSMRFIGALWDRPIEWFAMLGLADAQADPALTWRMFSRAGAAIYQLVHLEQQVYPWKLFAILRQADAANEVLEDMATCPNILDPVARLHCRAFPTVEQLVGDHSLAELEAMAQLVYGNTSLIEEGHAGCKRDARGREQTHAMRLTDSSAARVLRRSRTEASRWPTAMATKTPQSRSNNPAQCQQQHPQHCQTQVKQQQQKGKKSDKDKRSNREQGRPKTKKCFPITSCNAWMAAHVIGRKITGSDYREYNQAMQDPASKSKYTTLAKVMELAKQTQGNKKRKRNDTLAYMLRKRRVECHRGQQPWNPTLERAALQLEMHKLFQQRWLEHRASVRKRAADATRTKRQDLEELSRFANSSPSPALHAFDSEVRQAFQPYPVANPASVAYWWKPDLREYVFQTLPRTVQQDAIRHQTRWERDHSTIVNQVGPRIPPPSASERRARLCLEAGRCMCSASSRHWRAMQLALRRAMQQFMGPGSRRAGITEERRALEEGQVVVRIQKHGDTVSVDGPLWLHVALIYIDQTRPTFLRLFRRTPDVQSAAEDAHLTAAQKLGEDHPWWLSEIEALDGLDETAVWALDFWRVVGGLVCGVTANTCAQAARSVHVQRMDIQAVVFWQGQADLERLDALEDNDESHSENEIADEIPRPPRRLPPIPQPQPSQQDHRAAPITDSKAPITDSLAPIIDSMAPITSNREPINDGDVGTRPLEPSLEERIKAARSGEKHTCKAHDGTVLEMLFTYRHMCPTSPYGGFQVRCYHHEPDARVNKVGKTYTLPCRREIRCTSASGEAHVLRQLIRWIRDGPLHLDRLGHQKAKVDTNDNSDIEVVEEPSRRAKVAKLHLAYADEPAMSSIGSSSSSSTSSRSSSSDSDNDNVNDSAGASFRVHQPVARVASSTNAVRLECWVCGSSHDIEQCPFWMLALSRSTEEIGKNQLSPLGTIEPVKGGLVLPGNSVRVCDVPPDGDCFFHALGAELQYWYPDAREAPDVAAIAPRQHVGARWRAFLIEWIRNSSHVRIDGSTVAQWIQTLHGTGVDRYCDTMSKVRGQETWGGFFEAAMFCRAWGRNLCIIMMQPLKRQWGVMSMAGDRSSDAKTVCLAWHHGHWQRARMQPDADVAVREWWGRS